MTNNGKVKTGIFSGSFNPIHIGHLALSNYLCEYEVLDEVWFMVSPQNPLKTQAKLWSEELRLHLVQLAIEDYPQFRASDFEFHLPRPSYSVHTPKKLRKPTPNGSFISSSDQTTGITLTGGISGKRIVNENRLIVYPRPGYPVDETTLPPTVRLVQSPVFEISSTFIRESLKAGKDIRYFLHPNVWKAIQVTEIRSLFPVNQPAGEG